MTDTGRSGTTGPTTPRPQRRPASGRVVVVGALHLDRRFDVAVLPGPGETVHSRGVAVGAGGKGTNQAIAAAGAGAPTVMIGAVGADAEADVVLDALTRRGVDGTRIARLSGAATGGAVVLVDAAAENSIVIDSGANAARAADEVTDSIGALTAQDVVVLQNELPATTSRAVAARARAAGARVLWNAAPAPSGYDELVEDADVLLCNEHECHRIAALLGMPAGDPRSTARAVSARLGTTVVCTLGPAGALVADASRVHEVRAPRVRATDTTGAGDTFAGYLAAGLLAGLGLGAAALVAAFAGALAVTRPGAADSVPTGAEVQEFMDGLERAEEEAS